MDATDVVVWTVLWLAVAASLGMCAFGVFAKALSDEITGYPQEPAPWWEWPVVVGGGFGCLACVIKAISIVAAWFCGWSA